jgi:hypothetical protein
VEGGTENGVGAKKARQYYTTAMPWNRGPTGGGREPTPECPRSLGAPPVGAFQARQPIRLVSLELPLKPDERGRTTALAGGG